MGIQRKKILIYTLILVSLTVFSFITININLTRLSFYSKANPPKAGNFELNEVVVPTVAFPQYDWEKFSFSSNQPISFNVQLKNIPASTVIDVHIFKRENTDTARTGRFGLAGVQGNWDLNEWMVNQYEKYYDQDNAADSITGREMLEKHFSLLAANGVRWAGLDIAWYMVEKMPNQFNFEKIDPIFRTAKKYNISLVPMLSYSPYWASRQNAINSCSGQDDCGKTTYCLPYDLNTNGSVLYNNFVSETVNRYRPHGAYYSVYQETDEGYGISQWVIWNEEDIGYWLDCRSGTQVQGTINNYAALFKKAYTTIKSHDPQAKVIMGGLTDQQPVQKLAQLYSALGQVRPDIINVHYYLPAENLNSFMKAFLDKRDLLEAGKPVKTPVWVTEIGTSFIWENPQLQKNYLIDVFNTLDSLSGRGVEKALWWNSKGYFFCSFNDANCQCRQPECDAFPWERKLSLIELDFSPRESYLALSDWLQAVTYKGKIDNTMVDGQGKVSVNISADKINQPGEYLLILASPGKINIHPPVVLDYLSPLPTEVIDITPGFTTFPSKVPANPLLPKFNLFRLF